MILNRPILLIEDDIVDQMVVKRSVKELNIPNELYVAENGEEALQMLESEDHEKPGLILLDLNMPKMNGLEFLKVIKESKELRTIPVIILSTSKHDKDKFESFKLGVVGYMVKPVDFERFLDIMRSIKKYWSFSETI